MSTTSTRTRHSPVGPVPRRYMYVRHARLGGQSPRAGESQRVLHPQAGNMTTSGVDTESALDAAAWPDRRAEHDRDTGHGPGAEAVRGHHRPGPARARARHLLLPADRDPAPPRCAAVAGGHGHADHLGRGDPRPGRRAGAVGGPAGHDPAHLPGPVHPPDRRVARLAGLPRGGHGPDQGGHQ